MGAVRPTRSKALKGMLATALVALAVPAAAPGQGPAPDAGPAPQALGAFPGTGPLLADVAARPVAGRRLRVVLRLAAPAPVLVAVRRLPTGTLVTRRYTGRAGVNRWTVGSGLRAGRYTLRVIAVDQSGTRHSHRLRTLRVRR